MSEQRRSARIASEFMVCIKGVDQCAVLRRGDISVSGIYIDMERPIGALGSVQELCISDLGQQIPVSVMARLLRVAMVEDLRRGRVMLGAALEFLPSSPAQAVALEHLVRRVVSQQLDQEIDIEVHHQVHARMDTGDYHALPAQVQRMGQHRITLETASPVKPGEEVVLELSLGTDDGSRSTPLRGVVASVAAVERADQGPRCRAEVRLTTVPGAEASGSSFGAELDQQLNHLFEDLLTRQSPEEPAYPREHLTGQLSRIALTSLLGLFEMDRMTGELRLERDGESACVCVTEGLLAAVDGEVEGITVRQRMTQLLSWTEGRFEFLVKDNPAVPRGAGLRITGLLLDAAVEQDELHR